MRRGIQRRRRDAHARVEVAHHGGDLGLDELLRRGLPASGLALSSAVDFQGDLLAVDDDAALVEIIHRQLHAIDHVAAWRTSGPESGCATPILTVSGIGLQAAINAAAAASAARLSSFLSHLSPHTRMKVRAI